MNPIMQALASGYPEDEVLNMLVKKVPAILNNVSRAKSAGHSAKSILDFFSKSLGGTEISPTVSESEILGRNAKQQDMLTKQLIKLGIGTVGGGLLAGRALKNVPKIAQKIAGNLPRGGVPPTPQQTATEAVAQTLGKTEESPISDAATSGVIPPEPPKNVASSILEQMQLKDRIDNLLKNNPPEIIGPTIKSLLSPGQKTWLKQQTDQPIEEIVNEYIQQRPKQEESKAALQSQEIPQERLAILPDGQVGNLIEERQGIGSIELPNGQIRRRKLSEMDAEPPELAKQINDLISALPEEEKSRVLAFASYNPGQEFEFEGKKHNIPFMGVQFHNGDFYMYPGVSKEKFDKVVSKAVKAKTSGENEWGVWTQGDPSRGAGMHELIKELEKEFGKNFIKFKASEGYDFWKRFRKELKEYFLRRKGK